MRYSHGRGFGRRRVLRLLPERDRRSQDAAEQRKRKYGARLRRRPRHDIVRKRLEHRHAVFKVERPEARATSLNRPTRAADARG